MKYRDCAKRVLPPEDIDRVRDMVENLERLADIRPLIALSLPATASAEGRQFNGAPFPLRRRRAASLRAALPSPKGEERPA